MKITFAFSIDIKRKPKATAGEPELHPEGNNFTTTEKDWINDEKHEMNANIERPRPVYGAISLKWHPEKE